MTTNELKETCRKKGISFIPHHECGLCGQPTGWYLFERRPPYEVAYSSACGCGNSEACSSTWQEVLDWVCDKDGTLRPEYEYLKPDPADHKASPVERIKAMIREMMDQEMKNFKESVSNGEVDETSSPVVYTMLQVLMAKIEAMPKVWHNINEKADGSKFVVLYDVDGGYMSPPSRCMFGFDSMFINAMNKKYGANYTMWAYQDDLAPNKED